MQNVISTMLKDLSGKILIYLDDILLLGKPERLGKAKIILFFFISIQKVKKWTNTHKMPNILGGYNQSR